MLKKGANAPTVHSAKTSAAADRTRRTPSSAPLWVGSRLQKAVLLLDPIPSPIPPISGLGKNVLTVNSAKTSAVAERLQRASSSAQKLRKDVLEA